MDEKHYNTQFEFTTTLFPKKLWACAFVCVLLDTSSSYTLIFSVKLRSFNIPKDPQAPYALM